MFYYTSSVFIVYHSSKSKYPIIYKNLYDLYCTLIIIIIFVIIINNLRNKYIPMWLKC